MYQLSECVPRVEAKHRSFYVMMSDWQLFRELQRDVAAKIRDGGFFSPPTVVPQLGINLIV